MTTKQSVGYHRMVALFTPSQSSQPAATRAANVAARLHSQVTLTYISPTSDSSGRQRGRDDACLNALVDAHAEIAHTKKVRGDLLEIVRLMDEAKGDLLVLDRGLCAQLQALLEQAPETTCDHGQYDALVVGSSPTEAASQPVDYRHVMVATDLDERGLMTIYKAVRMARRYNARLSLLNVVDNFNADKEEESRIKNLRLRGLEAFASIIEGLTVEREVVVTSGSVDQAVSAYAVQQRCDLLVIGSHKFQGPRILLGGSAKRVIETGSTDVLVVHE